MKLRLKQSNSLFEQKKRERVNLGGNSKQKFSILMFIYCELKKYVVNYYFEDIRYQITLRCRDLEIRLLITLVVINTQHDQLMTTF